MDKLAEIMERKRRDVASRARAVSESELARLDATLPRRPSFERALRRPDGALAVIAEIKRRSPSAGQIRADADAPAQAGRYAAGGADALSVLTDEPYFGGRLEDLREASSRVPLPCLRKDFMVHPIQVLEARRNGASAILIIVRALSDEEIRLLHASAQAAGLDAIFEVHDEPELDRAVRHRARIIGVNNRDLRAFRTDLILSERLIPLIPDGVIAVSESGIASAADANRARMAGARAVLVGEALMRAADPGALIAAMRAR